MAEHTNPCDKASSTAYFDRSPFLNIAPEIRERIYQYLLGNRFVHITGDEEYYSLNHVHVEHTTCHSDIEHAERANELTAYSSFSAEAMETDDTTNNGAQLELNILRTNQLIGAEAIRTLYSTNTFVFAHEKNLEALLATLSCRRSPYGDQALREIRSIRMFVSCVSLFEWAPVFTSLVHLCPNIRHLAVEIELNKILVPWTSDFGVKDALDNYRNHLLMLKPLPLGKPKIIPVGRSDLRGLTDDYEVRRPERDRWIKEVELELESVEGTQGR